MVDNPKLPKDAKEKDFVEYGKKLKKEREKTEGIERDIKLTKQIRAEGINDNQEIIKRVGEIKEQEQIKNVYIFDSSEIIQDAPFVFIKINDDVCGFGFLLPKNKDIETKDGVVGKKQIFCPALIGSDHKIYSIDLTFENKHKIRPDPIPERMEQRFQLEKIKEFLDKKEEFIEVKKLLDLMIKQYEKYIYSHNPFWNIISALWDMGTYFFMLFEYYPIFEHRGLKGTAKTKEMKISRLMTFNATKIMTNPSESTLFRDTHNLRPTKYFDEAERLFAFDKYGRELNDPRTELINSSWQKGSVVPRQEKEGNKFKTKYYDVYSPTRIASINGLRGATEDRCITKISIRTKIGDLRGSIEPDQKDPIWQEIKNNLYIFALQNWKGIEESYNSLKTERLADRDFWLWKPLLSIAKYIDSDLYDKVLDFAEKITQQKKEDNITEGSLDFCLLKSLKVCLENDKDETKRGYVLLKEIKEAMPVGENEQWAKIQNKTISSKLDHFGFKEFRKKNREGAIFEISLSEFESIVSPICPLLFSSYSSHSSETTDKKVITTKSSDECVTNVMKEENHA